jgi:hypothetical protein
VVKESVRRAHSGSQRAIMSESPTYLVGRCGDRLAKICDEDQQAVDLIKPIECGKAKFWPEGRAC